MYALREWIGSTLPDWMRQYLPVDHLRMDRWAALVILSLAVAALYHLVRRMIGRRDGLRIASQEQLDSISPKVPPLKQWLQWGWASLLVFVLLAPLVLQPVRVSTVPYDLKTIVGVNDTSDSMLAEDVPPNRGVASQQSFGAFVNDTEPNTQVAYVTFGGAASLQVPPTTDRLYLTTALDQTELGEKTALLDGIDLALDVCERIPLSDDGVLSCRIAVLSDGAESVVPETFREERLEKITARANAMGVAIDAIGFGTDEPTMYKGDLVKLTPDKELLRRITSSTGGQFYEAADAAQLNKAYREIGSSFGKRFVMQAAWEYYVVIAMLVGLLAVLTNLVSNNQIAYAPRPKQIADERPKLRTVA